MNPSKSGTVLVYHMITDFITTANNLFHRASFRHIVNFTTMPFIFFTGNFYNIAHFIFCHKLEMDICIDKSYAQIEVDI